MGEFGHANSASRDPPLVADLLARAHERAFRRAPRAFDKDPTALSSTARTRNGNGNSYFYANTHNLILFQENEIREIRVSLRRVITRGPFSTITLRRARV